MSLFRPKWRGSLPVRGSSLTASLSRLRTQYTGDKEAALKLLSVGESKRNETLDTTGHAAWTGLCSYVEQIQAEPTGLSTYLLRIVPTLWCLSQRSGYRVVQHLSE